MYYHVITCPAENKHVPNLHLGSAQMGRLNRGPTYPLKPSVINKTGLYYLQGCTREEELKWNLLLNIEAFVMLILAVDSNFQYPNSARQSEKLKGKKQRCKTLSRMNMTR